MGGLYYADKIGERCMGIERDIIDMRLKWAKATGYAAAASVLCAVVFKLVEAFLEHLHILK